MKISEHTFDRLDEIFAQLVLHYRDGAVQELWQELEKLILSMANISSQHGKVRDCLYKIKGGPALSEESLYVSTSSGMLCIYYFFK